MALPQPNRGSETVLHTPRPHQTHSTGLSNSPQDPPPSYSAAIAALTSPASPAPQLNTATPPSPPLTPPPRARTPSRPHHATVIAIGAGRWETPRCMMINNRVSALGNRGADAVLPAPATAPAGSRRAGAEKGGCWAVIAVVVVVVVVGFIVGVGSLLHHFVPG